MEISNESGLDPFIIDELNHGDFTKPLIAVGLASLLMMVQGLLLLRPVFTVAVEESISLVALPYVISVLGTLLTAVIVWFLYSVGVHYSTILVLDASGELRDTVRLIGWGYVPRVIGEACAIVAVYWTLTGIEAPTSMDAVPSYLVTYSESTGYFVSEVVTLPFIFMSAIVWIYAAKNVYGLSIVRASMIVGTFVSLEIAWVIFSAV